MCTPVKTILKSAAKPFTYKHKRSPLRVQHYLRLYGNYSASYLHLNSALYHYELEDVGIVTYAWTKAAINFTAVVVADPLCSKDNIELLLRSFHRTVPGHHVYLTVGKEVADVLHGKLGFTKNQIGKDHYCDLNTWKPSKKLRQSSINRGEKAGLVIKEQKWAEVDAERVKEISEKWRKSKACSNRELQALTWPAIFDDEWGTRKFYVYDSEGKMVAFIWWMPCWRDGKVVGYTANCPRRDPDKTLACHSYVLDYAFLTCTEIFKAEGYEFAALGGAYGADIEKEEGDSAVVRCLGKWAVSNLSYFYNLKGVSDHKERYKSNRVPKLYACHKGPYSEFVYIIMPYIATKAIPHLSTGLFGKGVFIHKHNSNQEFLPVEDATTTLTATSATTTSPSQQEMEGRDQQVQKKKEKKGSKAAKKQKKNLAKQQSATAAGDHGLSKKIKQAGMTRSDSQRTLSCMEDEEQEELEAEIRASQRPQAVQTISQLLLAQ